MIDVDAAPSIAGDVHVFVHSAIHDAAQIFRKIVHPVFLDPVLQVGQFSRCEGSLAQVPGGVAMAQHGFFLVGEDDLFVGRSAWDVDEQREDFERSALCPDESPIPLFRRPERSEGRFSGFASRAR